ncbi:MAG: hypothetical protein AAGI54_03410 [Planctomycetota bacterium]
MSTAIEEIVIYIHGVSSELRGKPHVDQYAALHNGIGKHKPAFPSGYLGVEWGWNASNGPLTADKRLTDAQRLLGARVMPAFYEPRDLHFNAARFGLNAIRPLMLYGFSDMFYYVSADGKAAIRDAVADQIYLRLSGLGLIEGKSRVSITLVGHSAGSVIAFDLLFALFNPDPDYLFIEKDGNRSPQNAENFEKLRDMAQAGQRLRVRRLVTLGSPITMMVCRSNAVIDILANNGTLDIGKFGLQHDFNDKPVPPGPRWLNIWDRDDPIAWPVEPLVDVSALVEDIYPDVSDSLSRSHNAYWKSGKVHKAIAKRW